MTAASSLRIAYKHIADVGIQVSLQPHLTWSGAANCLESLEGVEFGLNAGRVGVLDGNATGNLSLQ